MFATDDTIVAVATPPGHSGIGVVRLSGPDAPRISQMLAARDEPFLPRHATFARLAAGEDHTPQPEGRTLDHVVITWFSAPHSYTGDDVVEIGAHGSPVILHRIVELAMRAGARLAEPGEFTFRAYVNGRMDLVQAEAVADLVDAVTPLQARAAMDQLEGTLTAAITRLDAALFDLSARLEASLDFPDEGFHFVTREETRAEIARLENALGALIAEGRVGRVLREGRTVVLTGRPNVGKSSLFNALVGAARAIVTAIPGTTRDLVTERVDIGGVPITLVDTAGLREAADAIESEGVDRARQARGAAALTIVVVDGSTRLGPEDRAILAETALPRIIVVSKADLPQQVPAGGFDAPATDVVSVSTVTGIGLDALRRSIVSSLTQQESLRDVPAISNVRHLTLVESAHESVRDAGAALDEGRTEELVLTDLAAARRALEEVTGRRTSEDLLRRVFERFCVGK